MNFLHDDVNYIDVDGNTVDVVAVPRARYDVRTNVLQDDLRKDVYHRNSEGDYFLKDQEPRMILRNAKECVNDGLFIEYYTMDDIDFQSLHRYRQLFSARNPEHVWTNLDDKEFLKQLGGYVINRREGTEGLTMAGLLMFGKGLPIRERFDNLRLDYIDKTDLIGDQRWSDRLTYDGTWENNLFNFIRTVMPRLTKDLPRPFQTEGMECDDYSPQHKAVQEAFTNAIIHADLTINGILKVEKLDDEFIFTNPGLLKLPKEQIFAGGESKARNQRMQNMFRMIGYGENLGSGFPLILNAWDEKDWMKPEIIEQPELLQVKLKLSIKDMQHADKAVRMIV